MKPPRIRFFSPHSEDSNTDQDRLEDWGEGIEMYQGLELSLARNCTMSANPSQGLCYSFRY